jgi:hypothetical protein
MPEPFPLHWSEQRALIVEATNARLFAIAGPDLDVTPLMRRNVYGDTMRPVLTPDDRFLIGSVVDGTGFDDLLFAVIWNPVTGEVELIPPDDLPLLPWVAERIGEDA